MSKAHSVRTTRHGAFQTAVVSYAHPVTGQAVTVVGTSHIADSGYWRHISALIGGLEDTGAVVHYESTRLPTVEERVYLNPKEILALENLEVMADLQKLMADLLGAVHQHAGLPPRAGWENTDFTVVEMIRALGSENIPTFPPGLDVVGWMRSMLETSRLPLAKRLCVRVFSLFLGLILRFYPFVMPALEVVTGERWNSFRKNVILDDRNRVAVGAATRAGRPVVMVWGAGHLPGIGALLLTQGFVCCSVRWFTALR